MTAQRIFVQQQTLTFFTQGHFLFVGEYFSHNNFRDKGAKNGRTVINLGIFPHHIFK
jgi:hypothetical protein